MPQSGAGKVAALGLLELAKSLSWSCSGAMAIWCLTVLLKLVLSQTKASRMNWGQRLPYIQMAGRSLQFTVDDCGVIAPVAVHSQLFWDTFHTPASRSLYILAGADTMVKCGIEECRCLGAVQL